MNLKKIFELDAEIIEVRIQESLSENIVIKDSKVEEISSGRIKGVSIRVIDKGIGFASSSRIEDLEKIATKAYKMAKIGEKRRIRKIGAVKDKKIVKCKIPFENIDFEERKEFLKDLDEITKDYKKIVSRSFSLSTTKTKTLYYSSEGSEIEQEIPRISLLCTCYARDKEVQYAFERIGAVAGFEALENSEESVRKACERALRLLKARTPPRGKFKVILDPKLTGVFIHEALGHAVEADHVVNKESILASKLNEKIASDIVTIYDDPTIKGSFGFYFYDDEGVEAEKKVVVENGFLRSYLHSRETAELLGAELTGNARAQNFSSEPIVRMSNTYLKPLDYSFEELIEDIDYGLYLLGSKGGEVDPARGVFQFSCEEGFIIEKGEIKDPIKDVALSGETLEILKNIDAIGKDFSMHIGFCGKNGQYVPVGDGGAHVRTIASVGGRK